MCVAFRWHWVQVDLSGSFVTVLKEVCRCYYFFKIHLKRSIYFYFCDTMLKWGICVCFVATLEQYVHAIVTVKVDIIVVLSLLTLHIVWDCLDIVWEFFTCCVRLSLCCMRMSYWLLWLSCNVFSVVSIYYCVCSCCHGIMKLGHEQSKIYFV